MTSESGIVLVTGASGFLGSHIVQQLLTKGYHVRGTARGKKATALKAFYKDSPSVEIVEISDIARDQFPEALQGVDAVIHSASPLPGRRSPEETLKTAIDGTLNTLRQAEKVGVKKFVVTSSFTTVVNNPSGTLTHKDWNVVTKEQGLKGDNEHATYAASKKYAELAVWEWAEVHPHVEVTTVVPAFLFGPVLPSCPTPPLDWTSVSTALLLWNLLDPSGVYPPRPAYTDVRDVAKAHINAIHPHAPSTSEVGRKRVLFIPPKLYTNQVALEVIARERPELKDRLVKGDPPVFPANRPPIEYDRVERILGIKKEQFHSLQDTILDTIDSVIRVENEWKRAGHAVDRIPPMSV